VANNALGFFNGRCYIEHRPARANKNDQDFINVTGLIGVLVATKMATLHELDSVYGVEDAYDLLEILQVERINSQPET
jgi:hypothetical protein